MDDAAIVLTTLPTPSSASGSAAGADPAGARKTITKSQFVGGQRLAVDQRAVAAAQILGQVRAPLADDLRMEAAGDGEVQLDFAIGVPADAGDLRAQAEGLPGGVAVEHLQGGGHARRLLRGKASASV
jgi:hypothetical protein